MGEFSEAEVAVRAVVPATLVVLQVASVSDKELGHSHSQRDLPQKVTGVIYSTADLHVPGTFLFTCNCAKSST